MKQATCRQVLSLTGGFRPSRRAAPLKPFAGNVDANAGVEIPPFSEGGPIEAGNIDIKITHAIIEIPPFSEGGPIEAIGTQRPGRLSSRDSALLGGRPH